MGTENIIWRPWRKVLVDPTIGSKQGVGRRHLPLFQWSNPSVKDHLALFTHGVVGNWTVPRTTDRDYFDQLTAGHRDS